MKTKSKGWISRAIIKTFKLLAISLPFATLVFAAYLIIYNLQPLLDFGHDLRLFITDTPEGWKPRELDPSVDSSGVQMIAGKDYVDFYLYLSGPRWFSYFQIDRKLEGRRWFRNVAIIHGRDGKCRDAHLKAGRTYIYRLKNCNIFRCSDPCLHYVKTWYPPPKAPTRFSAVALRSGEVELKWRDNSGHEQGFKIERATNGDFKEIAKTIKNETIFIDKSSNPGGTYTYRVSAFDEHFQSTNNPTASMTVPDLELLGHEQKIQSVEDWKSGFALVPAGNRWVAVGADTVPPEEGEKRADFQINNEIFFQVLDSGLKPTGPRNQITRNPCTSISPSLAWTGQEFGMAWLDSRDAESCWQAGDHYPDFKVYFCRISATGERIGPEIRISGGFQYAKFPFLFWSGDHYILVFYADSGIRYVLLDGRGRALDDVSLLVDTTIYEGFDAVEGSGSFAMSWTVWDDSHVNKFHLSALTFTPGKPPRILTLARNCGNESGCISDDHFLAPVPAAFWTGSNYGICWKNSRGETMVSILSPASGEETRRFMALPRKITMDGRTVNVSAAQVQGQWQAYFARQPPLCAWNGSEISVITTVGVGSSEQFGWARLDESGKEIAPVAFLKLEPSLDWMPSGLRWNGSEYFFSINQGIFVVAP